MKEGYENSWFRESADVPAPAVDCGFLNVETSQFHDSRPRSRQKTSPRSLFFFHAPSSRFYSSTRVPVFGQSNEPIPTQLSEISEKSTSSWPVSSRCRPETGRRNNSINFEFRNCNERFRTTSSRGRFFCDRSIVNLTKLISIKKRE